MPSFRYGLPLFTLLFTLLDEGSRMSMNEKSKLLRERQVELEYNLSRPLLRKKRWLGLPPAFVRIGRAIYYERSALDAFVESHRVTPNGREVAK